MENGLLPEDIRGGWYYITEDSVDDAGAGRDLIEEGEVDLFDFQLDETYSRRTYGAPGEEATVGEFSFDGRFLILRGPKTKTYRVHSRARWHWRLEGKKEDARLTRAPTVRDQRSTPSDELRRKLEVVPGSVLEGEPSAAVGGVSVTSLYVPTDDGRQLVASMCTGLEDEEVQWAGLTPMVDGLSDETWADVVQELLENRNLDPEGIELAMFDSGRARPLV